MTKQEILEYNKRCAEFLGWKYCKNDLVFNSHIDRSLPHNSVFSGWVKIEQPYTKGVPLIVVSKNRNVIEYKRKLLYHSDWNWIMEVYIKINKFIQEKTPDDFAFATETNNLHLALWDAFESENCSEELVVEAINQFLIWYKEQTL